MPEKPRYIFTLTTGHSGGTLLNLLLGASPAIFAAGESLRLWTLKDLEKQPEGTRSFWGSAAYELDAQGWPVETLTRELVNVAPLDLWEAWTGIVARQVGANRIIADKSLSLGTIRTICESGIVNPFFVHLIRDPRGVDFSYRRKYGADWRTAVMWQKSHLAIERFVRGRPGVIKVRYEDVASQPDIWMNKVLAAAGDHFDLELLPSYPKNLAAKSLADPVFENTIYAGNRMRHGENRSGRGIAADLRYIEDLPQFEWLRTSTLCLAGLLRYNYPVSRAALRHMLS